MIEIITKKYPFCSTPRQIGMPNRINVYSKLQFFETLNELNGIKNKLYYSIYNINLDGNFNDVNIDCISFDLDSDKSLINLRKIFEYNMKHNYKSLYIFSTKGFWVYIKSKNGNKLNNPKQALFNAQHYIAEQNDLIIGQNCMNADIDSSIVGDISRITRAINTKDVGRNRFCIVLRKDEIYKTYEEICEISKKPRFEYYIYGKNEIDMLQFDNENKKYSNYNKCIVPISLPDKDKVNINNLKCSVDISKYLPCVQSWLTIPNKGVWKARYFTALYFAQIGKYPPETEAICKEYFSKMRRTDGLGNNWNHMVKDRVIKKAYDFNKTFPNCDTLIENNFCPYRCEKYSGCNSPIYYNGCLI